MTSVPLVIAVAVTLAFAASLALTGAVLRAARARSILDYPSDRSSHTQPTPRGGGIAICVVVLSLLVWATASGRIDDRIGVAIALGASLIAAIGWMDDLKPVSARARLVVHLLASALTVALLGGMPSLALGDSVVQLGASGSFLAVIGLAWATNLFNFMDGIDGLASMEAISVAGVGGMALVAAGASGLGLLSLALAGACAGFLCYNWAPAKIFMGDVGSGFLGFTLAALAIASEATGGPPILVWAILAATFIVDASITFVRRLRRGSWRTAHRSHAYQRLVQSGWSHSKATSAVALVNAVLAITALYALLHSSLLLPLTAAAFIIVGALYLLVERLHPVSDRPSRY